MATSFFSSTLRPGYLVGLKTSISGNVKYLKTTLQPDELDKELGIHTSKWETERQIKNAAEQEAATKLRSEIRTMIGRYCSQTAFGMLCPNDAKSALDEAMTAAQEKAAEFNRSATTTRIRVNLMCGKIEPDDAQAVRAINAEVAELLESMRLGLEALDATKVRDAAKRARELGQMLSTDAQARITIAIEAARATATRIAKAGETNAIEVDRLAISRVAEARTAFLDLDQEREVQAPAVEGRALDLSADSSAPTAPAAPTREMEVND